MARKRLSESVATDPIYVIPGHDGTEQPATRAESAGVTEQLDPAWFVSMGNEAMSRGVLDMPRGREARGELEMPGGDHETGAHVATDHQPLREAGPSREPDSRSAREEIERDRPLARRRDIIGSHDDRQLVTATHEFPWRTICHLDIVAGNGSRFLGTGWFAGPRLIVTAGHNVYMHGDGGWSREISISPGRNGSQFPNGSYRSRVFRSVGGWVNQRVPEMDYGAIFLNEPATAPGNATGWFTIAVKSKSDLENVRVNVAGYPSNKPTGTQWWDNDVISEVSERRLRYLVDTIAGQSGAPVWFKDGDQRTVVGIHNYGHPSGNYATRITPEVLGLIAGWNREAGQ